MGWSRPITEPPDCSHAHYKCLPDEGGGLIPCDYKDRGCECLPRYNERQSVRECLMCGQIMKHRIISGSRGIDARDSGYGDD